MPDTVSAHPLSWPLGRPRTDAAARRPTAFRSDGGSARVKLTDARQRLSEELERLGARAPILSTNVELRLDGQPRAGQREPEDTGVALHFELKGQRIVLACDRWDTVAGNMAAIAAHIHSLRGQDRWGVGSVQQAFAGFLALAAPPTWRERLGNPATLEQARAAFRARMSDAHPDRGTGDHDEAAALSEAMQEAVAAFSRGAAVTGAAGR